MSGGKYNQIDTSNTHYKRGHWTKEENAKYLEAVELYGKKWKQVRYFISY